jgi:hypothetical protein
MAEWRYSSTSLDFGTRWWSDSRPGRFIPGERTPYTHWIGGWVGSRTGLEGTEKRKILPLPGIENPGRPARIPSLYGLRKYGQATENELQQRSLLLVV